MVGPYVFVALVVTVVDMLLLSSSSPAAHRVGWVVRRITRAVPADAPDLDPDRVRDTVTAEARQLDDGSLAVWYRHVPFGKESVQPWVPPPLRATGVLASAIVRRDSGADHVELRVRLAFPIAAVAFPVLGVQLAAEVGVWWLVGPPLAILAALAWGTWWAMGELEGYAWQVAPTWRR